MKFWFDTEFIERGADYPIDLISIGIVAEDDREFYAESSEANLSTASLWVQENVLPHLVHINHDDHSGEPLERFPRECPWMRRHTIARKIVAFCDPEKYGKPELWAYFADYDWVALCQLFGTMMDLPRGWPMYCRDIKQEADRVEEQIRWFNNAPEYKLKLPEQGKGEHHALADARYNRVMFEFLKSQTGVVLA